MDEAKMDEAKDDGGEDMDAKAFDRRARANVSVRRPVVDGRVVVDEARVPVPNRFHRTVVNYPWIVMSTTGFIAIVLAVMAFGAGESELGGSFTDISNIKVRRLYGFFAFREDYWKATGREDYWRRRLSSDSVRTRDHGVSKATLARIPMKATRTKKKERRRRLDEDTTDHGAPRREEESRFSVVLRARTSGDVLARSTTEKRCLLYTSPSPRDA